MMSFLQPFPPQECTPFLELRKNGGQAISHGQRNLPCIEAKHSNLPSNRENDEREMGASNGGAPRFVREKLAPYPIQPPSGLDTEELRQAFFRGKSAEPSNLTVEILRPSASSWKFPTSLLQ
jgi:hypothetical protein